MAFAHDPTNPANMSPEERVAEIAAILAEGELRLRAQAAVAAIPGDPALPAAVPAGAAAPEIPPESGRNCLEAGAEKRLHEHRG